MGCSVPKGTLFGLVQWLNHFLCPAYEITFNSLWPYWSSLQFLAGAKFSDLTLPLKDISQPWKPIEEMGTPGNHWPREKLWSMWKTECRAAGFVSALSLPSASPPAPFCKPTACHSFVKVFSSLVWSNFTAWLDRCWSVGIQTGKDREAYDLLSIHLHTNPMLIISPALSMLKRQEHQGVANAAINKTAIKLSV